MPQKILLISNQKWHKNNYLAFLPTWFSLNPCYTLYSEVVVLVLDLNSILLKKEKLSDTQRGFTVCCSWHLERQTMFVVVCHEFPLFSLLDYLDNLKQGQLIVAVWKGCVTGHKIQWWFNQCEYRIVSQYEVGYVLIKSGVHNSNAMVGKKTL